MPKVVLVRPTGTEGGGGGREEVKEGHFVAKRGI